MTKRNLIITLAVFFGILATAIIVLLGAAWYIEHERLSDAGPAFGPLAPLGVAISCNAAPFYRYCNYIVDFSVNSGLSDENTAVLTCLNNLPEQNRLDLFISTPKVTDASVLHLKAIRNLAYLDVTQTSISDRGITELKKTLRKTTVIGRTLTTPSP